MPATSAHLIYLGEAVISAILVCLYLTSRRTGKPPPGRLDKWGSRISPGIALIFVGTAVARLLSG